jgi:DNA polymerase III, epsilon subunit and related 3''-5'' exonucleases
MHRPKRPVGYFDKFLVIDCETSGLNFDNTSMDITKGYQSVSWGLIVSDLETMSVIEELYVEIKWDGESKWHPKAEAVHGLSKEYLLENGLEGAQAAEEIALFLSKHFGVDDTIICMGHNVSRFDIPFLKKLLIGNGFPFNFSHRSIDSSTLGLIAVNAFTSQQLFDELGITRGDVHNALGDARCSLKACRMIRKMLTFDAFA